MAASASPLKHTIERALNRRALVLSLFLVWPLLRIAAAQPGDDNIRIALEDAAALRPAAALERFAVVLESDSLNLDALCGASMAAVELGEAESDEKRRAAYYDKALAYARVAVRAHPNSSSARFQLSLALGVSAVNVGVSERVKYARDIREHALEALRLEPDHPGALHVMAMWHAEMMRISGIKRLLAKTFLGAGFMSEANWDEATRYMERSAALEPAKLRHHLDLARIYRDRGMTEKARACFQRVIGGTPQAFNDPRYIALAGQELARMKGER